MEENIDLKHVEMVENLHLKCLRFEEVPYLPLTVIYPSDASYEPFPYTEAFDDPEKMLYNELLKSFSSNLNSVGLRDHFPMQVRSNHGIGILCTLFGANCRIVNNGMPWVDHLEDGMEGIKKILQRGVPKFTSGLGKQVLDTHHFYLDALKQFPKCYKAIHVTQPDLQGPFDIAHLLLGSEVFYEIYDNPEIMHDLLDLITETYIGYRRFIDPYLTDQAGEDAVYIHGGIYGGKVLIKDDTALINLSKEQYEEFVKPYNQRIINEFTGSIHYCGPERKWHHEVLEHPKLKTIQYGNPEMHDLEYDYKIWSESRTPIVFWGWNQGYAFAKKVSDAGIKTGMTLACSAESHQEAVEILRSHVEGR